MANITHIVPENNVIKLKRTMVVWIGQKYVIKNKLFLTCLQTEERVKDSIKELGLNLSREVFEWVKLQQIIS